MKDILNNKNLYQTFVLTFFFFFFLGGGLDSAPRLYRVLAALSANELKWSTCEYFLRLMFQSYIPISDMAFTIHDKYVIGG